MISNETEQELKNLLGQEWSREEIQSWGEKIPLLSEDNSVLQQGFDQWRELSPPPLNKDFTHLCLTKIQQPQFWKNWSFKHFPSLSWTLTFATLIFVLGLWRLWPQAPIATFPAQTEVLGQEAGPNAIPQYRVRFAIQIPNAKSVSLLGDFNQWEQTHLTRYANDLFAMEMPLPAGSYAYGFLVDGKEFIPDVSGQTRIPDGLGQQNSVLNL